MKLAIATVLWATSLTFALLFAITISRAQVAKADDQFFVYEKDGHCELHSDAPVAWKTANGAGWVLVTSGVTHEAALQHAIDAGCPLEP